ncbi:unnamed protein product [Sphagnum jensenii]|uniref:Cyanobacterial aminoacyl-tRNA synthetase CAAD domain-containing protein n=1 Tax=Sphagnum jensenii TaxID=128206 RepID=A0ABP0W850_9BRYO
MAFSSIILSMVAYCILRCSLVSNIPPPPPPPQPTPKVSDSVNFFVIESRGFAPLPVRAVSSDDSTSDAAKQFEELYADLKAKWDGLENKTTVVVYAGGALVALWLSSTIVGAINSVPLLPKIMELVGLTYTGWFVYRYLLFKSSRKELVEDIEELKRKVTGASTEESF